MTLLLDRLRGHPIEARPRAADLADTYPAGRRCPEHGCITVLSIYNPGPFCFLHAQKHEGELLAALGIAA